MSEQVYTEIVATPTKEICSAAVRIREMAAAIKRNYIALEQRASDMQKINSSQPLQIDAKGIHNLPGGNFVSMKQSKIQQSAKSFVSTVAALSSPKLRSLASGKDDLIEKTQRIADEIQQLIVTNNLQALEFRYKEIESSNQVLINSIRKKHYELAREEQNSVSKILQTSLKEIGYKSVSLLKQKDSVILKANNSKTSIYTKVDLDGSLNIDASGFEGRGCEEAVDSLLKRLQINDIFAEKKEQFFHGKAEGGELVKEVEPLFNPLLKDQMALKNTSDEQNICRKRMNLEKDRRRIKQRSQ